MHLEMSGKWRPFCLSLNVLMLTAKLPFTVMLENVSVGRGCVNPFCASASYYKPCWCLKWKYSGYSTSISWRLMPRARFLPLALSKLRLCSANPRPGYLSNLSCDWPSTAWAYSEQGTENGPRLLALTGHQGPWHWLGRINWSLSSTETNFNCLCHLIINNSKC